MYIVDIEQAGRVATRKSGAFYKKGDKEAVDLLVPAEGYEYFLMNTDNERSAFRSQLFNSGYKTEWYKAPWHWCMRKTYKDGKTVHVMYVEGDVKVEVDELSPPQNADRLV